MAQYQRLIKDNDIILNGTKTRYEAEKEAFERLGDIEDLLTIWKIETLAELNKVLYLYYQTRTLKTRLKRQERWFEKIEEEINGKSKD